MSQPSRRDLIATGAALLLSPPGSVAAAVVKGELPWQQAQADPPQAAGYGPWVYFTAEEATAVEALVDRLIPPDPQTPGGKDAGCAVFIDRQLAGPYGHDEGLYRSGPFLQGSKQQGQQSATTPAQQYRQALAALDQYCKAAFGGSGFAKLNDGQKDAVIGGLEDGSVHLEGTDGRTFFKLLLKDTKQGFFADPIYGGNRGMVGWKMIGFPGARYDYRDWVDRHNERYPGPPISIAAHPDWTP